MRPWLVLMVGISGCGGGSPCDRDDVRCDTFTVPARRDQPDGRTYALDVLVRKAETDAPAEPLVLFNGGPGPSTVSLLPLVDSALGAPLRAQRDVVLIDIRGTGASGWLACPELQDVYSALYAQPTSQDELVAATTPAYLACVARLREEHGFAPTDLTTQNVVDDTAQVLTELGYDRWAAWGVSYGTIFAQQLARQYPEQTTAVVLDSPAPLDVSILAEAPRSGSLGLKRHFATCEEDPDCAGRDYEAVVWDNVAALHAAPARVSGPNPYTGERASWPVTGLDVLGLTLNGLTEPAVAARLPKWHAQIAAGDFGILQGPVTRQGFVYDPGFIDLWTPISRCAEQVDFDLDAVTAGDDVYGPVADLLRGTLAEAQAMCTALEVPFVADRQPLTESVPALIFAGEVDITTPPWMGEHIAAGLDHGYAFTVPGRGHVTIDACTWSMMAAFLADPAQPPDATCIDDLAPRFVGCDTLGRPLGLGLLVLALARRRR